MSRITLETVERTEAFWQRGITQYNKLIERLNTMFTEIYNVITLFQTKYGVFAYLTTANGTEIDTGGTFQPIEGTFNNDIINGFTVGVDGITYTGTPTQIFEVDWSASISCDDATRTVHVGIALNDEVLLVTSPSVMGTLCKNADQLYNMSGTFVHELKTGDKVSLFVTSSTTLDVITVHHFATTISKFYRS